MAFRQVLHSELRHRLQVLVSKQPNFEEQLEVKLQPRLAEIETLKQELASRAEQLSVAEKAFEEERRRTEMQKSFELVTAERRRAAALERALTRGDGALLASPRTDAPLSVPRATPSPRCEPPLPPRRREPEGGM